MERKLGWLAMAMLALVLAGGCGGMEGFDETELEGEIAARPQAQLISALKAAVPLKMRWIGASGVEFIFDNQAFLVDPYFTRSATNPFNAAVFPADSNHQSIGDYVDVVDEYLATVADTPVQYMVVSHTHWDHAADVPLIAKQTGAKVYGGPNIKNLMQAYENQWGWKIGDRAVTPALHTPRTIYESQYTDRKVELSLYPGEHNTVVVVFNKYHGTMSTSTIPQYVDQYLMDENSYGDGIVYAIKLKFIDGDKETTFVITPPKKYPAIGSIKDPGEKIDVLVISMTNWDYEEKTAINEMVALLQPEVIVPVHYDDYYSRLPNGPDQVYSVPNDLDYVSTLQNIGDIAEFDKFKWDVEHDNNKCDNGVCTLKIPTMFATFMNGDTDSLVGSAGLYTLIKARGHEYRCFKYDPTDNRTELGDCNNTPPVRNRWRYEPATGHIRNIAADRCLEQVSGGAMLGAVGATCGTQWLYDDVSGSLYTLSSTGKKLCLQRMNANWNAGNPIALGSCNCDVGQKWSLLTVTRIDAAKNKGLAMARKYNYLTTASGNDISLMPRHKTTIWEWSTSKWDWYVYDLAAFAYEPATGYIRVADSPAFCLHRDASEFQYGNEITVRLCSEGVAADKTWKYENGLIKARENDFWCMHKKDGNWYAGNTIHLWSCTAGGDEMKTWALLSSRGKRGGTLTGTVKNASGVGVGSAAVTVTGGNFGCKCTATTASNGTFTCDESKTLEGAYTVKAVPPCPYIDKTVYATVAAEGTQSVSMTLSQGATVYGVVKSGTTPLYKASVMAQVGSKYTAYKSTDIKGGYTFSGAPFGTTKLTYSKTGYTTVTKYVTTSTSACRQKVDVSLVKSLLTFIK